jgi:hypothetical protein
MTWKINAKEISSVLALPAPRRFEYFVKRVADWREVWSLRNEDGWVLASDDSGCELVPVWPHSEYARACANNEWIGTEPYAIDLGAWLDKWTPGMVRDGRKVAVFPSPASKGVVVGPEHLADSIEDELDVIE